MKVGELEEGVIYETVNDNSSQNVYFKVENGLIYKSLPLVGGWVVSYESYNDLSKLDFVSISPPPTDWSKVKVDAKISVRQKTSDIWLKRHFAEYKDGNIYAWDDGMTSYTVPEPCYCEAWKEAILREE